MKLMGEMDKKAADYEKKDSRQGKNKKANKNKNDSSFDSNTSEDTDEDDDDETINSKRGGDDDPAERKILEKRIK